MTENDLSPDFRLLATIRPLTTQTAHPPDQPAGEKVVRAQTRDGIARQQDHRRLADVTQSGRTGWPHRDSVNGQLTLFGHEGGGMIFLADARTSGDENHIRSSLPQRLTNGIAVVFDPEQRFQHAAVTFDQAA